jgi:hypothetical protein
MLFEAGVWGGESPNMVPDMRPPDWPAALP